MIKSIKSKLNDLIDKKAQKIRDKRVSAATIRPVEDLVYEFFSQVDEAKRVSQVGTMGLDYNLCLSIVDHARAHLENQISLSHDNLAKVEVVWDQVELNNLLGVKIYWSDLYATKNNIDVMTYIDITQMLLI